MTRRDEAGNLTPERLAARAAVQGLRYEYEDGIIEKAERDKAGYAIEYNNRTCFGIKDYGIEPKKGQRVRVYGGLGRTIRGVDIEGQPLFHMTQDDLDADFAEWQAEYAREKAERFERERPALDAKVAALPEVFKERIARFRASSPDWRREHEAYELASCVDAVKMARWATAGLTPDQRREAGELVQKFARKSSAAQRALVPDLDNGHSGNTFGMAVRLAFEYVTDPGLVVAEHAAIAALVGCEDAGCPPLDDAALQALRAAHANAWPGANL